MLYDEHLLLGSFILTAFLYLLDSASWQQAFSDSESIRLFLEFCALQVSVLSSLKGRQHIKAFS